MTNLQNWSMVATITATRYGGGDWKRGHRGEEGDAKAHAYQEPADWLSQHTVWRQGSYISCFQLLAKIECSLCWYTC